MGYFEQWCERLELNPRITAFNDNIDYAKKVMEIDEQKLSRQEYYHIREKLNNTPDRLAYLKGIRPHSKEVQIIEYLLEQGISLDVNNAKNAYTKQDLAEMKAQALNDPCACCGFHINQEINDLIKNNCELFAQHSIVEFARGTKCS